MARRRRRRRKRKGNFLKTIGTVALIGGASLYTGYVISQIDFNEPIFDQIAAILPYNPKEHSDNNQTIPTFSEPFADGTIVSDPTQPVILTPSPKVLLTSTPIVTLTPTLENTIEASLCPPEYLCNLEFDLASWINSVRVIDNSILFTEGNRFEGIEYVYGGILPKGENRDNYFLYFTHWDKASGSGSSIRVVESGNGNEWSNERILFENSNMTSVVYDGTKTMKLMVYKRDNGFMAYESTNGIDFNQIGGPYTNWSDVANFFYDFRLNKYVGYVKRQENIEGVRIRTVARVVSDDFINWSEPQLVLVPNQSEIDKEGKDTHFYGMAVTQVQNGYLGVLWIYEPELRNIREGVDRVHAEGNVHLEWTYSSDGINWNRTGKWVLNGEGNFQHYSANQIYRMNQELWLLYGKIDQQHSYSLKKSNSEIWVAR